MKTQIPANVYVVTAHRDGKTPTTFTGTVEHLATRVFGYTLECGASYQHEKGNKKIDRLPKTIAKLITNLDNAVNNSAANGYAGKYYTAEAATPAETEAFFKSLNRA